VSAIRSDPAGAAGGLESALARVLQVGTYSSMALVAVGVVLFIGNGGSPLDAGPPLKIGSLITDLAAGRAAAFLWLGILGIVATPGLRVAGALVGFARGGERGMALVAALILAVVAVGVLAGLVTG
jgi:uncharacterized membrane protein